MSHFILDNCIYFNSTQFFFFIIAQQDVLCVMRLLTSAIFRTVLLLSYNYNDTTFMWCVHVLFDTDFYLSFKVKTTTETLVSPSQKAS